MARYLYSELATLLDARTRCKSERDSVSDQTTRELRSEWFDRHTETIERLLKEYLPSGSGFDDGTKIDLDASHAEKLVFITGFHHMNEIGYYAGWTKHVVAITPSLASGFHIRVSGRNRNEIKDYIHEAFDRALRVDLTDQFEYERLAPKYGLEYKSAWADQCTQTWNVYGPIDGQDGVLIQGAFKSWMAARAFAVRWMQALDTHGDTSHIPSSADIGEAERLLALAGKVRKLSDSALLSITEGGR